MEEKFSKVLIKNGGSCVIAIYFNGKEYNTDSDGFFQLDMNELSIIRQSGFEVIVSEFVKAVDKAVVESPAIVPENSERELEVASSAEQANPEQANAKAEVKADDVVAAKVDNSKKIAFKKDKK